MKRDLVSECPRCKEKLVATRLSGDNCEMELSGDFPLSKFDYLSIDENYEGDYREEGYAGANPKYRI